MAVRTGEITRAYSTVSAVLEPVDLVVVLLYLGAVLVIGIRAGRHVQTGGDFFVGGRSLPFWAIGMSIVVSDIGAIDMISGAGGAYRYGVAQANFDWIGSMPAMVIVAFLFIPYLYRSRVYTIPEFLGRRYGVAVQLVQAAIWLGFLLAMLALMLWMSAVFLGGVLGWSTTFAIWVTVAVVGLYTTTGGLRAVIITDAMQMIVMSIGFTVLVVLCLVEVGGIGGLIEKVSALGPRTDDHFSLLLPHDTDKPYPWSGIVFGLGMVLSTAYFCGNQAVIQRTMAARSEWDAKAAMLFAALCKLFVPVLVFLPGLAAVAAHPDLPDPDQAVPKMIVDVLPPGLTGLVFAAFFAALMSSVDSYLNSSTTVLLTDFYGRGRAALGMPPASGLQQLRLGRAMTVVFIVAAGFTAPVIERFETIYVALQTLLSLFQGPTLAILLLGVLWRRATGWGALTALVGGVGLSGWLTVNGEAFFPSNDPFLFISFWSFVVSLVTVIVVSLLTPPEPLERIRGLVVGHLAGEEGGA
ncbi:MAG: sodium/solute symporter [Planctomycetota bacterium]|nr:sodium/solute symporter [Planctomycetota bacterium]